jgi:hypothetical protein
VLVEQVGEQEGMAVEWHRVRQARDGGGLCGSRGAAPRRF